MSTRPIAYVMEQTLGSITHYLNLRGADAGSADDPKRWLPIDYRPSRVPWTVSGSWAARQALRPMLDELAGVFIHTMTLAPATFDYLRRMPTIISSDGPAMAKRDMRDAYGNSAQHRPAELAKRELYRAVFGRAAGFVAWSNWAKESFVRDYGCRDQDVAVIPPAIDLELFAPGDRDHALPRILFVGGDFKRKGGDLLLEVFRRRLRGQAELVLVTRDELADEPGVTVHRDVGPNSEKLRELYATSDIFALPTRADCYSLVAMEALAAGLPVVIGNVGGIPDLIRENQTGHLFDPSDAGTFERLLLSLVQDSGKRAEMSYAARIDAQTRFSVQGNADALFSFVRSRC